MGQEYVGNDLKCVYLQFFVTFGETMDKKDEILGRQILSIVSRVFKIRDNIATHLI